MPLLPTVLAPAPAAARCCASPVLLVLLGASFTACFLKVL
jgi:hypothetical protein